jgi:MFS family permease
MRMSTRAKLPAGASLGVLVAAYLGLMLAASAPSPLYVVYQERWHFSAITLTTVFGVYALVLLLALLTVGGLSDYVGRKPVLLAALALLAASMIVFARADGVAWLYAARVLQGVAAGSALGAVSAGIVDFAGPRTSLAALLNSVIPMLGLALGALVAGGLVQYAPDPRTLVFLVLAAAVAAVMIALVAVPETAPRRPGARASLTPRVRVAAPVRGAFARSVPGLVAPWAQVGFTLSLATTLAAVEFRITSDFLQGLAVAAVCGSAFAATLLTRALPPPRATVAGAAGLIAGAAVTLASLAGPWDAAFYAGSVLTGLGAGATLGAVMRALGGLPAPQDRGEFFAAVYIVGYLAFSVPAIVAGVFVVHAGLVPATIGYGIGVSVLALVAMYAALRPGGGRGAVSGERAVPAGARRR